MSWDKRKWNIERTMCNMATYSLFINNVHKELIGCIDDVAYIISKIGESNIKSLKDINIDEIKDWDPPEKLELCKKICFDFLKLTQNKIIKWKDFPYIITGTPDQNEKIYNEFKDDILKILKEYSLI